MFSATFSSAFLAAYCAKRRPLFQPLFSAASPQLYFHTNIYSVQWCTDPRMVGFSMPSAHPQLVGRCRASEQTHDSWDSVATVCSLCSSAFDGTLSPSVFPHKVGLVSYSMCCVHHPTPTSPCPSPHWAIWASIHPATSLPAPWTTTTTVGQHIHNSEAEVGEDLGKQECS